MTNVSRNVLIALGSNENSAWGDAKETIQKAMFLVSRMSDAPPKLGGLFATPAFPAGAGPDFVNAGMAISSSWSAPEILAGLHEIEAEAGRQRTSRWGQRTLDLDLIAVGDLVLPDQDTHQEWRGLSLDAQQRIAPDELILPHPRLQDRAFVLVPLMDVAPEWQHPLLGLTIAQMCADLPNAMRSEVTRLTTPQVS